MDHAAGVQLDLDTVNGLVVDDGGGHTGNLELAAHDADVAPELLQRALASAVDQSFNCITVDGDMSTNPPVSSNCGGNRVEIISSKFKKALVTKTYEKYDSEVNVSSFDVIAQIPYTIGWLTNLNIVKTQWPSDNSEDGNSEDYMLFLKNEQSVSKLIQPYYYFASTPGSGTGIDYIDYDDDQWWQAFDWEEDVLIPSMSLEEESTLDTSYTVYSNVAKYEKNS